jgi:eukaryotic-like serine/threonine-protein kinase
MMTLLGGRYRLGERIAAGGMGAVYRAVDQTLDRAVAVKLLKRELADDPAFLERFRREARAAAAVAHPGVAGVYDYGELGGQPFIVMELVAGETLAERLAAGGRLDWGQAFALGEQVARALAAAHAHGLVHRDVKPANILLDPSGRAKLVDFGIAQATQAATLTRTGMALGSANYVAPEQAQGGHVGPAADLYSLGCVLFEAVTGRTPYTAANPIAVATQHVSAPVPEPRRHLPGLPGPAADLIARALAKDPDGRFASAAAMADELAAARTGRAAATTLALPAAGRGASAGGRVAAPPPPLAAHAAVAAPVPTPPAPWTAAGSHRATGPARPAGWRPRPGLLAGLAFVVVALLLLAWLTRDRPPDAPAGAAPSSNPRPAAGQQAGTAGSSRQSRIAVPDVVGQKVEDAERRLRALGLAVEVEGGQEGRGRSRGRQRVAATDPGPGGLVDPGATVRLQVADDGKGRGRDDEGDGDD